MKPLHRLCAIALLVLAVLPFIEPLQARDPNSVGDNTVGWGPDSVAGEVLAQPGAIRTPRLRILFGTLPLLPIVAATIRHTQLIFVSLSVPLSDSVSTRCQILRV
jgi:hypothetical protein